MDLTNKSYGTKREIRETAPKTNGLRVTFNYYPLDNANYRFEMRSVGYLAILGFVFFIINLLGLESIELSFAIGTGVLVSLLMFDYDYVRIETGIILCPFGKRA